MDWDKEQKHIFQSNAQVWKHRNGARAIKGCEIKRVLKTEEIT